MVGAGGHGAGMRWVLMLFVILAAVMGGEARAVVVTGRAAVSERVGKVAMERRVEDLRGASRRVAPEVEEAAGLADAGPLEFWFPSGSAVARSDCGGGQGGARPIDEVGLGDRVLTAEAGAPQESGTAVMDPASWRAYALRLTRADGTVTRVDLLRPAGWEQVMALGPDGRRTIHLERPEMGVSGEAEVLAVSPCPPVEPGVGRVVTGTFRKERNHGLRALHGSVAGEVSYLRVKSGHPVWSVTRGAWIGAGELAAGEALAAWRGEPVAVLANLPEADTATWNLEVENEHVYRVGPAGILVHNTCPTPKELFEGGGSVKSAPIHRVGGSAPSNLALKPSEAGLQPPGISVLQGGTAGEAAAQMRAAYPNATRLHAQASTVGTSTASRIEGAGFRVMPDPSKRFPNHARITHPDGADGFNDRNLQRLSEAFDDTTGH
jgi:hypothetical protein